MAILAFVEKLALIRGHRFTRPEAAMRTRNGCGQFSHAAWTDHVIGASHKRIQRIPCQANRG
jgi:hypothetical protein